MQCSGVPVLHRAIMPPQQLESGKRARSPPSERVPDLPTTYSYPVLSTSVTTPVLHR